MLAEEPADDRVYGPELRKRLLAGFRGDVPPLKPSFVYRLGLIAVASAMLLLPVVYAALIGGSLWGLWVYAARVVAPTLDRYGPVVTVLWSIPVLLGLVVVTCLVKPLFAKPAQQEKRLRLDPAKERLLFDFVGRLCKALQAPAPKEIQVDCQVNAGASFRRGLLSLFSHDMVLVIGLPLIESLSVQQLAGVMAHELGHFSQKAGLRVSFVIRILNTWLVRLVYQRDRFDAVLEHAADHIRLVRVFFMLAVFFVWLGRKVLWILMMIGHMLSSFMMQQLEYDADRYEVRLAGFAGFDFSMRELFSLGVAYGLTIEELEEQWKDRRLVDNLPRLVVANRREKVRQIGAALESFLSREPQELFGTHPTARQRTARALREKGVGVFSSDLPASVLFSDLEALEREASLAYYRGALGNQVRPPDLLPIQAVRERQQQDEDERAAFARFYHNASGLRGLLLEPQLPAPPADLAEASRLLEEARRNILEKVPEHTRGVEALREAASQRLHALRAQVLLTVGYRIKHEEFGLPDGDPSTAARAADAAQESIRSCRSRLEHLETSEVRRLELALALLGHPEVASRLPGVSVAPDEVERFLACGALLARQLSRLIDLREARGVLDILAAQLRPNGENPPQLIEEIRKRLADLQAQLKELHRSLRAQPYPFDHRQEGISLAQHVIPSLPTVDDLGGLAAVADGAMGRLREVQERVLGRLAWLAEKAEEALGMLPLGRSEPAASGTEEQPASAPAAPTTAAAGGRIAETKAEAVESREVFLRYFRGTLDLRPAPLPEQAPEPPADPQAAVEGLWGTLLAVQKEADEHARRIQQYRGAEQRWIKAVQAEQLLLAGFSIQPEEFGLVTGDSANALRVQERAVAYMGSLEPALRSFEEIQRQRLAHALALLGEPQVAARLGHLDDLDRWRPEIAPLLACGLALHRSFPALRELRKSQVVLGTLGAQSPSPRLHECVVEQMASAHRQLRQLQRDLHVEPFPFVQSRSAVTLGQKAVPGFPSAADYDGIFQAMASALREMTDLHRRVLGRLAGMAERVERALGLGGR